MRARLDVRDVGVADSNPVTPTIDSKPDSDLYCRHARGTENHGVQTNGCAEANTAELFRTKIKGLELEAERLQQEAMFAMTPNLETKPAESVEAAARALTPGPVEIMIAAVAAYAQREAGTA